LRKSQFGKAEACVRIDSALSQNGQPIKPMKKLFCILASAALLGGCEQKETVVAPGNSPAPEKKVENNTTVVNPTTEKTKETKETTNTNTTTTSPSSNSSTTTTTTSSPSP
jgi:uncharacterized lipoprotein YajG